MTSSFENPFIPKPDNLKPDSAEFLQKFAGASHDQLEKAGVTEGGKRTEPPEAHNNDHLRIAASDAEREAYEKEIVEFKGVKIKKRDLLGLQSVFRQLNSDLKMAGQEKVVLGEGDWEIGETNKRIIVNLDGDVDFLSISYVPLSSLKNVQLPANLRFLFLDGIPTLESLDDVILPSTLYNLDIGGLNVSSIDKVVLPPGLHDLSLAATPISSLDHVNLPTDLYMLQIAGTAISSLNGVALPPNLHDLYIDHTPP